jgi:uncharacterized protein YdaU (DUF1376 family)
LLIGIGLQQKFLLVILTSALIFIMPSASELKAQLEAQRRAAKEQEERMEAAIMALQIQEEEEAEKKRLEEERLRKEAEEKVRREAEEKMRREAEEKKREEDEKLRLQFRSGLIDVDMDAADSEWVPLSPWSTSQVLLPILEAEQGGVAEGTSAAPMDKRRKMQPCYNCRVHGTPCERPE